jgi:vesicle-fusing ATPase
MDARNALFGKGPRGGPGLPGRKVQGGGNPGGYSQAPPPPADYNNQGSYGAPSPGYGGGATSPGMNRQQQRMSGGYSAAPSRAISLEVEKL